MEPVLGRGPDSELTPVHTHAGRVDRYREPVGCRGRGAQEQALWAVVGRKQQLLAQGGQ